MSLSWKMLDLAVRRLNVSALSDWKVLFSNMDIWMQAVLVGTLVLLVGVSALSCWWGLKMNRYAQFAAGAAFVFHVMLILLFQESTISLGLIFVWSAVAGVAGGFLYAFLERGFQFVAGFVFGTVLSVWILHRFFDLETTAGAGRIWTLVISLAVGALFALAAKRLKIVLTALEGGVVLGLLCGAFLPVDRIPWINEKLAREQVLNLLPFLFAATGFLVQFLQYMAIRAEKKSLQIPTGEEKDSETAVTEASSGNENAPSAEEVEKEEIINMAQAEEVLVEKAKELALAARSSAQHARRTERYEDVSQGLYSVEVAASRLGMSDEAFLRGMKEAGFSVPGEEESTGQEESETTAASQEENETVAASQEESETATASQEESETATASQEESETKK